MYVQAVYVYRFAHALIHVFPAQASLTSAHAFLIFGYASSKDYEFQSYGRMA
jgi:hypothetical protein